MSLFSSIQLANNAIRAQQIGLQVTGQNIANANTPGYLREEVVFEPAPTQRLGRLLLGLGVDVTAVVQKVDYFLQQRLRGAVSDRAEGEIQEQTYLQLEGLMGELSDTDLSTALNNFFSSIHEILNSPESGSVRNLAVLQGKTLATDINRLAARVGQIRSDLNDRIKGAAADINRLLEEVRVLNIRIAETEGGDVSASDAVGLRDQRNLALNQLAELIDIRVQEQPSGTVTIFSSGDYLVFEGVRREVAVVTSADRGLSVAEIRIADIDAPLQFNAGEVAGLMSSRDEVLGGFLDKLDSFASTLAFEFNKVFSSGQGLNGYQTLTSFSAVDSTTAALDAAGLPFTPVNGSFQIQVFNNRTGLTQTTDVNVDLNGLDDDMSLTTLASAIDAIDGISASVSVGKLTIRSDSSDQEFAFARDTSGVLAALGVNSFFNGSSARDIAVASDFLQDPSKFAASGGGIAEDTSIAVELANFLDRPLTTRNGATLSVLYDQITGETTQASTVAQAVADGARVFEESLEGQHLAISGVSIDEEVVRMIQYQRAFQASAKYIGTLSELLDILVNL